MVNAHDIVLTLANHLKPCEQDVLDGLADGLLLRDIASRAKLSYPTALKYRRKIAALTIKLEIASPLHKKERTRSGQQGKGGCDRDASARTNGHKHHNPLPNVFADPNDHQVEDQPSHVGDIPNGFAPKETACGEILTKYISDPLQREQAASVP